MDNEFKILVAAKLNKELSEKRINDQLKQLKLDTLKLNVDIDGNTSTIKSEIQQVVQQANQYTKSSVVTPINIPFQFDTKAPDKIKNEMDKIVKEIGGEKGALVKYNINTNMTLNDDKTERVEKLTGATLQYRNELNELVSAEIKYQQISEITNPDGTTEAIMGWSTATQQYHQNIEKTIKLQQKQAEEEAKVFRGKIELAKQMDILNAKSNNAGVQLNPENQAQFNAKIDSASTIQDLQEVNHYLKMAKLEYQELNAVMSKDLPNNALDNANKKIANMAPAIDILQSKFQLLGKSAPDGINTVFDGLRQDLLDINNTADPREKIEKFNQLSIAVQRVESDYRKLAQEQKQTKFDANLGLDKSKLDNRITIWLNENQKAAKKFGLELKNIQVQISGADRMQLGNLTKEFQGVQAQAKALGLTGRTFFGELGNNINKFKDWFLIGGAVATVARSFKQVFSNVVELDKALVDLQMATGGTRVQTQELLKSYVDLGKEIGATTTEVADSANGWLRQGKTVEETNILIKDSMILSKVGMLESAQATEYLTSAMKGYKVETKDTLGIVDKLAAVDMKSATSAGGLAEAMSRTANSANIAGVSMDKLIGYMATVGEVTQKEMSSIGESFKTTFSRMGNIKIGKFIDDETGESLSDVEAVLGKLDIKLRSSDTTFRNFGDVLDDVGNRWNSFNDVEQSSIAVAIAGVRQRENFLTLMENYGTALEYTSISADSAGTALEKMNNYEKSVEKSQKALTASFEGFSNTILNSGLIKGTFDAGSGILGFFTELIKNLGIIPTLAVTAAGALSGIKNIGISNVKYAPPYPCGTAA